MSIYERFTDRARTVFQLANQEAQRANHETIDPLHLFVAMVKEGSSVAWKVLHDRSIDVSEARGALEKLHPPGPDTMVMGKLSQTPGMKCVTGWAIEEARKLNHNYVGTEHLLLGWLRLPVDSAADEMMKIFNLDRESLKKEVLEILNVEFGGRQSDPARVFTAVVDAASKPEHNGSDFADDSTGVKQDDLRKAESCKGDEIKQTRPINEIVQDMVRLQTERDALVRERDERAGLHNECCERIVKLDGDRMQLNFELSEAVVLESRKKLTKNVLGS